MARSDEELQDALRRVVQNVYDSGDLEELTVKRVRRAAEVELGLEEGFFKTDEWKERSKDFISGAVANCEKAGELSSQVQIVATTKQAKSKAIKKDEKKTRGAKRKQGDAKKPRKRRKTDSEEEDISGIEEEDAVSPPIGSSREPSTEPPPPARNSAPKEKTAPLARSDQDDAELGQSESEMSILDDEPPKRKRKSKGQNRTSDSTAPGKENKRPSAEKQKSKSTPKEPSDPNQEEIKRLQGWLVKCGIRKMWWKELQPFDSPKAKIAHLKEMLAEAGMTGRYSQEKASQIRDERELKADLEAVQEGAKIWGKEDENVDDGGVRPRRQVAKGLQGLDFLNDDDGEETD